MNPYIRRYLLKRKKARVLRRSGGASWGPATLFAASEQGVWYDPSYLTSMFQDSSGATPAAVNSPVGLMLDKRLGLSLGTERVSADALTNAANWTVVAGAATVASVGGNIEITNTNGAFFAVDLTLPTPVVVGQGYRGQFTVQTNAGTASSTSIAGGPNVTLGTTPQTLTAMLFPSITGYKMRLQTYGNTVGQKLIVSFVSFKHLPGNHATQATVAARPMLRQNGAGKYYLEFDGVDDILSARTGSMPIVAPIYHVVSFEYASGGASAAHQGIGGREGGSTNYNRIALRTDTAAYSAASRGGALAIGAVGGPVSANGAIPPNVPCVLTNVFEAGSQNVGRNGVMLTPTANSWAAGNTISAAWNSGAAAFGVTRKLYGVVDVGRVLTASEKTNLEAWMASKAGVTL